MNSPPFISTERMSTFYALIIVSMIALVSQLVRLQVIEHISLRDLAIENRQSRVNEPAPRGVIYDRNGIILAHNLPSFNVIITPADLPDDDVRLHAIYQHLAAVTGTPISTPPQDAGNASTNQLGQDTPSPGITEAVYLQQSIAPYDPVVVAQDVPREVAMSLSEELRNLPGVDIKVAPTRDYPTGALTSHVIGYMGPITQQVQDFYIDKGFDPSRDKIGYAGIEAYMQDILSGKNGSKVVEHDVAGLELRAVGEVQPAVPGNSLTLTLDIRLQAIAEGALRQRMKLENQMRNGQPVTNGVVIAMDPRTGEILALISLPTYDNQQFARFIPVDYYTELHDHPHRPLLNQAISGEHPPGSVFKLAIAAGALQEGIVTPDQRVSDPGEIEIVNRYFPNDPGKTRKVVCWKRDGHGSVDFITGLAQSCDVYFYALGGGFADGGVDNAGLGIELIHQYSIWLGYDQPTGIELPGELGGLIPNRDWKRLNIGENWSTGDTYIASIGQGYVLATPLQVLNSFTPFINGGALVQPTIIREVLDGEGNVMQPFTPRVIHQTPLNRTVLDLVADGLRQVMIEGTGDRLEGIDGITLAGKTGTAEYCDNIAQEAGRCQFGSWPAHAWFVGYAPFEDPEIAVLAFIYSGEEGATVAGPVVMEVLKSYFELKDIERTKSA